jgi:hypothetical protein|tara:strand:- start:145 stop:774 length:630 start_codon:yes stop_codon:yes gene_type:complete
MNKICLIIQGPSVNVNILKDKYKNMNIQIIFSTWEGEESKYNENDIVIFNKMPKERGIQNVMLQQLSTYNGLLKAKELGFENAIKIRSDSYFTDLSCFLKNTIDYNKLNFLFFLDYHRLNGPDKSNNNYKYVCDYIQLSSVDNLLKMWDFKYEKCSYSEQLITNHVFNTFKSDDIAFIGDYLTKKCDIYWISRKTCLSTFDRKYYKIKI